MSGQIPGLTRVTDGFLGLSRLFNIPTRSLRSSAKGRANATSRSSRCITEGCCGTGPGPPTLLESCPRVSGSPRPKRLWYVPGLGSAGWAVPVSALGSVKSFVDAQVRAAPVSKGSCLKLRVSSRLWLTGGQTSLSRPWAQPSGSQPKPHGGGGAAAPVRRSFWNRRGVQAVLGVLAGMSTCTEGTLATGQAEFPSASTTSQPGNRCGLRCLPRENAAINCWATEEASWTGNWRGSPTPLVLQLRKAEREEVQGSSAAQEHVIWANNRSLKKKK